MAKKKKSVELSSQEIHFMIENVSYKVLRHYPTAMTLDVIVTDEDGKKLGMQNIPFAHIPKKIKKLIKPN